MTLSLKRIFFILVVVLQFVFLQANTLDFYFTVKRYFDTESQQNYLEFAYLIPGNVIQYKEETPNKFKASILIVVDVKNNDNLVIFNHAYIINSPVYSGNPDALVNLSDVLRIPMTQDSLSLIIQALDLNDSTLYFTDNLPLNVLEDKNAVLSDVSLIAKKSPLILGDVFNKGDLNLLPKFINYYPSQINNIAFYVESYQKGQLNKGLFNYFISDENNVVLEKYSNFKKTNASDFDALYAELDILSLPSGNYYVYVELRDSANSIIDRKRMYFQRQNNNAIEQDNHDYYELNVIRNNFAKKYDLRNISHHLKALQPISDDFEKAAIIGALKSNNIEILQNYLYSFWSKRDAKHPEERWNEYADKLQFVEQEFGNSMIEGHETSRGRVFLQYGKPFERIERNTSQYGQIEIWRYENINNQGNIEFLFIGNQLYDDEFQLVHSNLTNEIFNKEWSQILKLNNF
jgi:GWxTD domain-containing protein